MCFFNFSWRNNLSVTIFTILQYAPSIALPPGLFSQVLILKWEQICNFLAYTSFFFCIMHFFSCCTYIFDKPCLVLFHGVIFHDPFFIMLLMFHVTYYVFHFIYIILTSHWFIPTRFPFTQYCYCTC